MRLRASPSAGSPGLSAAQAAFLQLLDKVDETL